MARRKQGRKAVGARGGTGYEEVVGLEVAVDNRGLAKMKPIHAIRYVTAHLKHFEQRQLISRIVNDAVHVTVGHVFCDDSQVPRRRARAHKKYHIWVTQMS